MQRLILILPAVAAAAVILFIGCNSHKVSSGERKVRDSLGVSEAQLAVMHGYILPLEGGQPPKGTEVYAVDSLGGDTLVAKQKRKHGLYTIVGQPCHEYVLECRVAGAITWQRRITTECGPGYQEIVMDIELDTRNALAPYVWKQAEASRQALALAPNNAGAQINTRYNETTPVLSADGLVIFFTSDRPLDSTVESGARYIYTSYRDPECQWQPSEPLPFDGSDQPMSISSLGPDGLSLFGDHDGDIQVSRLKKLGWGAPEPMGSAINSPYAESGGVLAPDGGTFYFISDRPGGSGGTDIYRAVKDANGDWGAARNLGTTVNSSGDEKSPSIHPDGRTLHFASDGLGGLGGFDVFGSTIKENGFFGIPANIGDGVNTAYNESGYSVTLTPDGTFGYFNSDRPDGFGGFGWQPEHLNDGDDAMAFAARRSHGPSGMHISRNVHRSLEMAADDGPEVPGTNDIYVFAIRGADNTATTLLYGMIRSDGGIPRGTEVRLTDRKSQTTLAISPSSDGSYAIQTVLCRNYHLALFVNDERIDGQDLRIPCSSVGEVEARDMTIDGHAYVEEPTATSSGLQGTSGQNNDNGHVVTSDTGAMSPVIDSTELPVDLRKGHIAFFCQDTMVQNKAYTVWARVGRHLVATAVRDALASEVNEARREVGEAPLPVAAIRNEPVEITGLARVELVDPEGNFKLTALTGNGDKEINGQDGEWQWEVVPLKATHAKLKLVLSFIGRDGEPHLEETSEYVILVEVEHGFFTQLYIDAKADPKWAFGAIIIPLIVYVERLLRRKRRIAKDGGEKTAA